MSKVAEKVHWRPPGQYKQRSNGTLRHRSHTRTVHRPRKPSRVGTSQPQAFAFDVHAHIHAAKLWSPGFGVRRTWGEDKNGGRKKSRLKIQDGKHMPSHARETFFVAKHFANEPRL
jgi:hypothetical protein